MIVFPRIEIDSYRVGRIYVDSNSYRTVGDKNQAIIEIEIIADHLLKKRKKLKLYSKCYKNPLAICGFRVKLPFLRQRSFTLHIF